MIVTLIVDASFDHPLQRGAWAAWAKSERGKIMRGGMIKHTMGSSTIAEACAFANGIYMAMHYGILVPGDKIVTRIDNVNVINRIEGTTKKGSIKGNDLQVINSAIKFIRRHRDEHGIELDIRHIKAHSGTEQPAKFVHNQVDKLARKHLRKWRDGQGG